MQSNPGYAPSKHVLESKDIDNVIANVKKESDSRFELARVQQENNRISRESSNVGSPGFEYTEWFFELSDLGKEYGFSGGTCNFWSFRVFFCRFGPFSVILGNSGHLRPFRGQKWSFQVF